MKRPYPPTYLIAYSEEHVAYEIGMLFVVAELRRQPPVVAMLNGNPALNNAIIEALVIHVRNVIEFLYATDPRNTDVVAVDFCAPGTWDANRPPITPALAAARARANKEIGHLTTARMAGAPPGKAWDFEALRAELRPIIELFVITADPASLSPKVKLAIPPRPGA